MTKHTNEKGIERLKAGSVKVGTLREYTVREGRSMLSTDPEEGCLTTIVKNPPGLYMFSSPTLGIKDVISVNCREGPSTTNYYDGWIYCASYGEYSRARHERIVHGHHKYIGNSMYTEYAIIDVAEFCDALAEAVGIALQSSTSAVAARVSYAEVENDVSLDEFEAAINAPCLEKEFFRRTFRKPELFAVEEEIRISVDPIYCKQSGNILEPIFVQSERLANSIKQTGSLKLPEV